MDNREPPLAHFTFIVSMKRRRRRQPRAAIAHKTDAKTDERPEPPWSIFQMIRFTNHATCSASAKLISTLIR
jgi:hypothetical protein